MRKIVLVANHRNFGLITKESWYKTEYILYDDGSLRCFNHKGCNIIEEESNVSAQDLDYIIKNTEDYIRSSIPHDCCDGSVWEIDCNGIHYELDYVNDTDIEKVTNILLNAYQSD